MTSHFSSATSASTVVSNVATSPEYTSYPKQDDAMLWNLYADAMFIPPDRIVPEVGKQMCLHMILSMPGGRAGAIEYLKYVKRTLHNPDITQIGVRCLSTILHLILTIIGCHSFNAPRKAFYARPLNSITSKSFTTQHIPAVQCGTPGTFISLAQALPQASALIGLQRALIS